MNLDKYFIRSRKLLANKLITFLVAEDSSTTKNEIDEDRGIHTSKADNTLHGIGLNSIEGAVTRNGGVVHFKVQDKLFVCNVMLKVKPINEL